MGRWKRKKEYYSNKKNSTLDDDELDRGDGKPLAPTEVDRVKAYLQTYRDGCFQMLNTNKPDINTPATAPAATATAIAAGAVAGVLMSGLLVLSI